MINLNVYKAFLSKNRHLSTRIEARALIYAVFVSFFIVLIVGTIILLTYFHSYYIDRAIVRNKLISNAESGILYVISTPNFFYDSNEKTIDLYGDLNDSVTLRKKNYGAYQLIFSEAIQNNKKTEVVAMVGYDNKTDGNIALYLPDQNNELTLCGKSFIRGNCFLPKRGVEKGCIGTNNFLGDRLINGSVYNSEKMLPKLNEQLVQFAEKYFNKSFSKDDSIIYLSNFNYGDSLSNTFINRDLVLISEEFLSLTNTLKGNIIIISEKTVHIKPSAKLTDIIIFAPFIEVESGFEGSVQLIASDSVRIKENVNLLPTSFIGVIGKQTNAQNTISIESNCIITGTVLLYKKNNGQQNVLSINAETEIHGMVYCNAYTDLKGTVYGSIYTNNFVSKKSSFQLDKLEDAIIDRDKLSTYFSGAVIFNEPKPMKIIKWLY